MRASAALACRLRPPILPVRAGKVGACGQEVRSSGERLFEHYDGLPDLVLRQECLAQKSQAIDLTRRGGLDRAK